MHRSKAEDALREADFARRERGRVNIICTDLGQQVRIAGIVLKLSMIIAFYPHYMFKIGPSKVNLSPILERISIHGQRPMKGPFSIILVN